MTISKTSIDGLILSIKYNTKNIIVSTLTFNFHTPPGGLFSVYRLTIFLWCQPQLLQFNQTVESSHFRKGCLNSNNMK